MVVGDHVDQYLQAAKYWVKQEKRFSFQWRSFPQQNCARTIVFHLQQSEFSRWQELTEGWNKVSLVKRSIDVGDFELAHGNHD
jgi:hypothetical protein